MKNYITLIRDFLTKNTSSKQTVIKNTFWLLLAEGVSKGAILFITIFIAKKLWPEEFGAMNFTISFVSLFVIITDFWLSTLMIREVSRHKEKIEEYFFNFSFLKLVLAVLTLIIIYGVSILFHKVTPYLNLILIYCMYSVLNNIWEFIRVFFRPSERMEYEWVLKLMNWLIFAISVCGVLYFWGVSIMNVFIGYLLSSVVSVILSLIFVLKKHKFIKPALNKYFLIDWLKKWFFIAVGTFFISVYTSTDQIVMGAYWFNRDLGVYSFAYRFTLIYALIWWFLFQALLPNISRFLNADLYFKGIKKILLLNLVMIIVLELILWASISFNLFDLIWLSEYNSSIPILMLLLIYCYIEPLGHWAYIHLISLWKERVTMVIFWVAAVFNLLGNLFLIPHYSYYWAIITTIWSYVLFSLLTNIFVIKFLKVKPI